MLPDRRTRLTAIAAACASAAIVLALPPGAGAATTPVPGPPPPPNDALATAQTLSTLPATVAGTTVGATVEKHEPAAACGAVPATVWYQVRAGSDGSLVVRLRAAGQLDAIVAVFLRARSKITPVACRPTDERGRVAFAFPSSKEATYLVAIGEQPGSQPGPFTLDLRPPDPAAIAPGRSLVPAGVRGALDPLQHDDDAWATTFSAGVTYRMNLRAVKNRCLRLGLYAPHTASFSDADPVLTLPCGGYATYTPGPDASGRYSVRVSVVGPHLADVSEHYHLEVAAATRANVVPGLPLRSGHPARGRLAGGGVDVVRLYRFDLALRSDVELTLHASANASDDLRLLREAGGLVSCACGTKGGGSIHLELAAGHYYVEARANASSTGGYSLLLLARTITATSLAINANGKQVDSVSPGRSLTFAVKVQPATSGRAELTFERFDPVEGWLFTRVVTVRLGADGTGQLLWQPPSVGRWRVRTAFMGTPASSPSQTGDVAFDVEPLLPKASTTAATSPAGG